MTEELQVLQRQAIQKTQQKLPASNALAGVGQAFSQIGQLGAFAAEKIAVGKARERGAQAALSGDPRALAPGLTKATQAFNESYNSVNASMVTLEVAQELQNDLKRLSAPGQLNSDSVAIFNEYAKKRIEGALEGVDPSIKALVGLKLTDNYVKASAQMANKVEHYNQNKAKDTFATLFSQSIDTLSESRMAGDTEGMKQAFSQAESLIDDFKNLGFMTDLQESQARKQLNMQIAVSDAQASYLESVANGTEEQFLANLANKKPQGMSNEEWLQAQSEVLKLKGQQNRLVAEQESLSVASWNQKILTGEVSTLAQLESASDEMSAISYLNLQNKIISQQIGSAKTAAAMQQFVIDNTSNPGRAARASNEVKNAAYDQLIEAETQRKREATGDESAVLSLQEKALAAQAFNVPVQAFNDELGYALQYGDDVAAMDAVLAYQELAGTPGGPSKNSPVLSLSKDAQRIAVSSLFRMNYGTQNPSIVVQGAREAINNKDDVVVGGRMNRYKEVFGGSNFGKLKTKFKDTFGVKADDNPVLFEAYQTNLRENVASMPSIDEALEMTRRSMAPMFAPSKYGPSKKQAMQFAPENTVGMANEGHWFGNQFYLAVNQAVKDNSNISFVGDIPSELNQEDVFGRSFGKPQIQIGDRVHEVFLLSDPSTGSRESGRLTYGLYYKDANGFTQPVPDINNPLGVAEFEVMPFEQFLPEIHQELSIQTFEQIAKKEAGALFDRQQMGKELQNFSTFGVLDENILLDKRNQFIKENADKIAAQLSGLPVKERRRKKDREKKARQEAIKLANEVFKSSGGSVSTFGFGFNAPSATDVSSKERADFIKQTTQEILREMGDE